MRRTLPCLIAVADVVAAEGVEDAESAGEDRCCCCSGSTTTTARTRSSTDRGAQGVVGRIGGLCTSTTNKA